MSFSFDNWVNENKLDPDLCEILKGHYIVSETSILGLTEKDLEELFDGLPKKFAFRSSFRLAQRSLAAQRQTNLDNLKLPVVEPQLFVDVGLGNSANTPSLSNNIINAHVKSYGLSEAGAYSPDDKSRINKGFIFEDDASNSTKPKPKPKPRLNDTKFKTLSESKDSEENNDSFDTDIQFQRKEQGFTRGLFASMRHTLKTSRTSNAKNKEDSTGNKSNNEGNSTFRRSHLYASFAGKSNVKSIKPSKHLPIFVYNKLSPAKPAELGMKPKLVKQNFVKEIYKSMFRVFDRRRSIHLMVNTLLITEPLVNGKFLVVDYCMREDADMISISSSDQVWQSFPGFILAANDNMVMCSLKNSAKNEKTNNYYIKFDHETDKTRWLDIFKPPNKVEETSLVERRVKIIRNYQPEQDDEIELMKGDDINLIQRHSTGWCKGEKLSDHATGWFPSDCIEPEVDLSDWHIL